jgi:hypothetical protein
MIGASADVDVSATEAMPTARARSRPPFIHLRIGDFNPEWEISGAPAYVTGALPLT